MKDSDLETTQHIPVETVTEVIAGGYPGRDHLRFDLSDTVRKSNQAELDRMVRSQRPTVDIRPMRLRMKGR